jgi:PIN domain nuclease of toxin-antitoxin system
LAKSKSQRLLLDTHIWLRYQGISGDVNKSALPILHRAAAEGALYVSVISVWETAMLVKRARLSLNTSVHRWAEEALSKPGISLLPFSPEIAIESVNLPAPIHKDPADRILIASARVERMTLVTRDVEVLEFATRTKLAHLRA